MMLLGSYAVTLVHMFSGGRVMLLNGAALAAKRGVDLHVAKREELLLGKCCCFSDDSSLCAAASGAAVSPTSSRTPARKRSPPARNWAP